MQIGNLGDAILHEGHVVLVTEHDDYTSLTCRRDGDGFITRFEAIVERSGDAYVWHGQKRQEGSPIFGKVQNGAAMQYKEAYEAALDFVTRSHVKVE